MLYDNLPKLRVYPGLLKPVLGFLTKRTLAFMSCMTGNVKGC